MDMLAALHRRAFLASLRYARLQARFGKVTDLPDQTSARTQHTRAVHRAHLCVDSNLKDTNGSVHTPGRQRRGG
jgi:hypothetical protein